MLFYGSLLLAFVVTLIAVSKIATMCFAKRSDLVWILLASIVSAGSAILTAVLVTMFVKGISPLETLILSLSAMFIVSSAAFKGINQLSWAGAVTTNIANIVITIITMTAAIVLNGKSLNDELSTMNLVAKQSIAIVNPTLVGFDNNSLVDDVVISDVSQGSMTLNTQSESTNEEEVQITEKDLLPPSAVKALEEKKKVVYKEPKFHVTQVGNIRTLVGYTVRVLKSNGSTISGALKKVSGSDAYIEQRISNGTAITPIALASIHKLEVYRK